MDVSCTVYSTYLCMHVYGCEVYLVHTCVYCIHVYEYECELYMPVYTHN